MKRWMRWPRRAGLAGKAGERAVIESLEIPDQVKKLLIENNNGEVYQEMGVQIFEDYVGKYLADRVIRVIIFTVLFTVFYASLHIVIVWLNLLSRLPIIYGLNKIAGAVLGLTEALIFVWIGCLVLTLFSWQSDRKEYDRPDQRKYLADMAV